MFINLKNFTVKVVVQVFYFLRMPCVIDFCLCVESVLESVARERLELLT